MTGKRNTRHWSSRPLWSDQGSFCTDCNKFSFPDNVIAQRKLEELKKNIRYQKNTELLHTYKCPFGQGWHIGHDRQRSAVC